ncbi:hypothetical protein WA026_009530 [Henosepilachna vigintioctopunctata]|uniref:Polycomb protein Sfmbt n=1 Tax=Henosepilachna vigintioctopunctata TaxID=420089 RepID=A0AAW1U507_9CUCU
MNGVADMGMVWMGAGQPSGDVPMGLMGEHQDLLMDQENPYFTPSHHSMSNQSLEDMQIPQTAHMVEGMENLDMMHFIDIKNESNDSSYIDDDNTQPVYITTATQTMSNVTRKIKPVKHPGLVLKTPIAYQSDTDPSVIPIQKDGIAVCEKCGAIGVKHAFYTRERRFCSMACARGYSGLISEPMPQQPQQVPPNIPAENQQYAKYKFSLMKQEDFFSEGYLDQELPQLMQVPSPSPPAAVEETAPLTRRKGGGLANSYDWDSQLSDQYFIAAPVTCFKHAPMFDMWDNIMVGMKVEVENTDCDNASDAFPDSFWVATVIRIVGYKALLRYEGFGSNDTKDFWVSLCSNQVHPVGWCATRNKPLIPPKTIEDKYSDWKDFLRKRLTGARTLPSNFTNKVNDSMKSRFVPGLNLEVVDKNRISQVKVAIIHKIIGRRLNVRYYDMAADDPGFWAHEDSPLLHPVGWAKKVGHHLVAPVDYLERMSLGIYEDNDATDELFTPFQAGSSVHPSMVGFVIGMKLEAIDPLNLSSICVATVMDVLRCGYIMIRIDSYESDATGADWFCYHIKSPCIFPATFCEKNNIPLTPPKGYEPGTFSWNRYLSETGNVPATLNLFNQYVPLHGFVTGMKIEAADLMDPRLVCIATLAKVVGRLLKVHFDGWEEEYDQWLDCESPDIYPVGWCQSVGHKLEGPPVHAKVVPNPIKANKAVKKKNRKKKTKDQSCSPKSIASSTRSVKTERSVDLSFSLIKDEPESSICEENLEPETAQESIGPDQNLPVAAEATPPPERKVTSYVKNTSSPSSPTIIPRLIDNSGGNCDPSELHPIEWNVFEVAQFLRVNDCANYCDAFSKQKIDGKTMLNLNKEDILEFTGGKVGPSLKIYDLIQQLKIKVNPSQSRQMKANIKKFL